MIVPDLIDESKRYDEENVFEVSRDRLEGASVDPNISDAQLVAVADYIFSHHDDAFNHMIREASSALGLTVCEETERE